MSVYAADKIAIYDSQGKTSVNDPTDKDPTQEMLNSLNTALTRLSSFTYQDGGWQFSRRGFVDDQQKHYFFQFGGQTGAFDMDVRVRINT